MPRGDGTGPAGMGPMTGRAAGYCAGYSVPGYANPISGCGFGFGRGRGGFGRGLGMGFRGGRGWGGYGTVPYAAPVYPGSAAVPPYGAPYAGGPTPGQEVEMLKGQAKYFEEALKEIRKEIADLETQDKEEKK